MSENENTNLTHLYRIIRASLDMISRLKPKAKPFVARVRIILKEIEEMK
jgi:hypothetical protein